MAAAGAAGAESAGASPSVIEGALSLAAAAAAGPTARIESFGVLLDR